MQGVSKVQLQEPRSEMMARTRNVTETWSGDLQQRERKTCDSL